MDSVILDIAWIAYLVLTIGTVLVLVLDNRNPVRTMAWSLVLLFLPFLGLVLYFFFGQNYRRKRKIHKSVLDEFGHNVLQGNMDRKRIAVPARQNALVRLFEQVNHAFPFEARSVEVYTHGHEMLQALLQALENARSHIHLQFYIFENDAIGALVRDVLIKKAQEGVQVRVLYDDVGCWSVPNRFFREMRDAGIEVHPFWAVHFPFFSGRVNYRNHRKVVVIDGCIGFIGGMNLALRYFRKGKRGLWRDTHLKIEGRPVYGMQRSFLADWYFVTHHLLGSSEYFPQMNYEGGIVTQIVTSEPLFLWEEIMLGMVHAIYRSSKYCYIQSPYFLPTDSVLRALQTMALSGVDIRLMVPARSDSILPYWGMMSYLEDVLRAGVRVFVYKEGFLHAKMLVCDDSLSTVGSTNMDFRSFEHNFEINAFLYGKEAARKAKRIFLEDQRRCYELTWEQWKNRPFWHRCLSSFVRILAPLL